MKTSSCWKGVLAVWTRVLAPNAHVVRPSRRSLCSSMPGLHPMNCTAPSTLLNCSSQKLALVSSYFSRRMTTDHLCRLFWRVCGWSTHSRRVYIVVCTFYLIDLMYSTSQLKLIGCFFVSRQHVNITSCYKCTMRNTQRFLNCSWSFAESFVFQVQLRGLNLGTWQGARHALQTTALSKV